MVKIRFFLFVSIFFIKWIFGTLRSSSAQIALLWIVNKIWHHLEKLREKYTLFTNGVNFTV
jgi:hypothetical protein